MRKKTLRNFLSFLLVLVCTVTAVAALHLVTRAQAPSLPAVEEALPAAQLSASVPQQLVASPLVCVGAFLGMLAIVAIGLAVYRREKRCGKRARQGRRSYIPRADMAFPGRFTSEQGRQLLPALFLRRTKAAGKAPRRLVSCVLPVGKAAGQPLHILLDGQSAVHLHHGAA